MNDASPLSTYYPESKPWFDISSYLLPGLRPRFTGSAAAQVDGNTIHYAVRLVVGSEYVSRIANGGWLLFENLPKEFRVGSSTIAYADYLGTPSQVVADTAGRIVVPTRTGQDPSGTTQIGFVMTGWRAA
ncbi:hypothetical protein CIK76_04825 [Glutamicibacter sp. BW80]|nr:hypothetical protein CIK76_04825 [Glutamicibacter sp. BW80]